MSSVGSRLERGQKSERREDEKAQAISTGRFAEKLVLDYSGGETTGTSESAQIKTSKNGKKARWKGLRQTHMGGEPSSIELSGPKEKSPGCFSKCNRRGQSKASTSGMGEGKKRKDGMGGQTNGP